MAMTYLYKPKSGKPVSVQGMVVPAEGIRFNNKSPVLDRWVGKVLSVSMTPKAVDPSAPVPAPKSAPVPAPEPLADEPKPSPEPAVGNLDEIALMTEEEAKNTPAKALRAYANKFGLSGRSHEDLMAALKEAGKLKV